MNDFLIKIIPVILIFFLGILLKKLAILDNRDGDLLLRLVFNICLPSLTIISLQQVVLLPQYLVIPVIAWIVVLVTFLLATFASSRLPIARVSKGTFMVGCLIMNTAFIFPFVLSAFGEEGFAFVTIFQFGNSLAIFTFIYYIAMRHSPVAGGRVQIKKFLTLPPVWALLIGIGLNLSRVGLPPLFHNFFEYLGTPTIPLVMLSLGIYFRWRISKLGTVLLVFLIRIGAGLLSGLLLTSLFQLQGMVREIVIICCAAPVGYNTLVFSSLEKLDRELAASLVSLSLLLGIIYVPLLILII